MRRTVMIWATLALVLGVSFPASADDESTISFTFNVYNVVTVSIKGIRPSTVRGANPGVERRNFRSGDRCCAPSGWQIVRPWERMS